MLRTILTATALTVLLTACEGGTDSGSDGTAPALVPVATAPGVLDDPTGPDEYDYVENGLKFRCNSKGEVVKLTPDLGKNRERAEALCADHQGAILDDMARGNR